MPTDTGGDNHQFINQISGEDSDIAKYNLYHTIKAVMNPLPTYDYIFYLYNVNLMRFEFVLIKATDFGEGEKSINYQMTYNPNQMVSKYYLCNPKSYSDVRNLVEKVNRVYASSIPLQFVSKNEDYQINNTFATWAATTSITIKDLTDIQTMNCIEINDAEIKQNITSNPALD
jgi:hypothetical protein